MFLMPVWAAAGPVSKVLEMLSDLKAKGEKEKQTESVLCKKYQVWSAGQISATTAELANARTAVETKEAEESSAKANENIQQEKAATASSVAQNARADLESVKGTFIQQQTTLEKQIAQLEDELDFAQGAYKHLETSLQSISQSSLVQIADMVQAAPVVGAGALFNYIRGISPGTNKITLVDQNSVHSSILYEQSSSKVLDLVHELVTDLDQNLQKERSDLVSTQNNYELESNSLQNAIDNAVDKNGQHSKKAMLYLAQAEAASKAKTHFLSDVKQFQHSLTELTKEATQQTAMCTNNLATREDELKALTEAIVVLSTDVEPVYQARRGGNALLQLDHSSTRRDQITSNLRQKAHDITSVELLSVAEEASKRPFDSVIEMIKDMTKKLEEQQASEKYTNQKCVEDLTKSKKLKEEHEAQVDKTTVSLQEELQNFQDASDRVALLQRQIAASEEAIAQRNQLRSQSHDANVDTIEQSKQCVAGTQSALEVLQEFYGSAPAAALNQMSTVSSEKPELASEYKGMQAESQSILAILETIQSDCQKESQETQLQEAQEKEDYEAEVASFEAAIDVATKQSHRIDRQATDAQLHAQRQQKNLDGSEKTLYEIQQQLELRQQQCQVTGLSYEERKAAREKEIEALQEVLVQFDGF